MEHDTGFGIAAQRDYVISALTRAKEQLVWIC